MTRFALWSPHSKAAAFMIAQALTFALMAVSIRLAANHGIHVFEIAFFRNFFGLLFALPLLIHGGIGILRTQRFGFYVLRCLIGLGAMFCGFWAVAHLPLSKAIALSYTAPLFVTIGAIFFLGEIVRWRRATAVVIGFVGALVIVRPGMVDVDRDTLIALLAAVLSASAVISIKSLSRTEPVEAIVVYMVLIMTPLSLLPALTVWQWPDAWGWLLLIAIGGFGTLGHVFVTRAYKLGEASALQPFNYVQLPFVAVLGYLLFAEKIDIWLTAGAGIIIAAGVYIAHREVALGRRTVTDPNVHRTP